MAKLNQIIAIEKGIKSSAYGALTELNKAAQKPDLFNGFSKTYRKKEEDGEELPPEGKRVQYTSGEVLRAAERALTDLVDVTARKDWSNCVAKADVVIDGKTLIASAPVSFLLFMEKQLTDLRTLVGNLPVLDVAEDWKSDPNSGLYRTEPTETHRTKKMQKPIVLYAATPEHPAQTQLITEDVIAGWWVLTRQSGAMPKPEKQKLQDRIDKLIQAIKQARESANMFDETDAPAIGAPVFGYLLGS
jgi:hypothetical protein